MTRETKKVPMDEFDLTPGKFIRMRILKMRQVYLAQRLGISQPAVARMESLSAVPESYRERLRFIATTYGRTIDDAWFDKVPTTRSVKEAAK